MHPLLAKLTGKSALKNWSGHLADIDAEIARLREAAAPATTFAARLAQAVAAFDSDPTPEHTLAVVTLKSQETGAFFMEQHVRDLSIDRRRAALVAGQDKFEAAVAEVRRELERRRTEIQEDDAKRTTETGETVVSERALAAIARKLDDLDSALAWFGNDPTRGASHLQTVIG